MNDPLKSSSENVSVFGPSLRFKGELSAGEDLVIHGEVEGTIGPAPRVTIGPEARVKATINADVIVVQGHVDGDHSANDSIVVQESADVRGNIHAPVVNIAQGAKFNGGIKMEPLQTQSAGTSGLAQKSETVRTGTSN